MNKKVDKQDFENYLKEARGKPTRFEKSRSQKGRLARCNRRALPRLWLSWPWPV